MLQSSIFAQSPSFNSYSSNNFAEIAAKVCEEFIDEREELGLEPALHSLPVPETLIIKEEEEESEEQISSDNDLTHLTHQQQEEEQPEQAEEVEVEEEVVEESGNNEESESDGDDDDDDDFEFTFVCRDPDGSPLSADELFANGQIRPVFPVFNRDLLFAGGQDDDSINSEPVKSSTLRVPLKNLFLGDRDSTDPPSSSSSEADELENLPAGTYCVWTPKGKGSSSSSQASPETCKKSNSTGSGSSSSRRFRFRDFLFRSNSDGKDTFVFLTPSGSGKMKKKDEKAVEKMVKSEVSEEKKHSSEAKVAGKGKSKGAAAEVSPHEIHYVRNRALKQNDRRRSYLPYRQDLVGFFANVNGLSRNLHPF